MMLKQSLSRNQRSKGFKVKHALQICVLLAICIWLLYQVKHSYDKKKAYGESSVKLSEKVQSGHEILKIGRKGLDPLVEETASENEKRGREEEEEEESRVDENDDEGRGGGDDETDAHDQARAEEEEYEQGEDLIDVQDEEREEESEEQDGEEKENLIEDGGSSEDQDHSRGEMNSEEAREENHKSDDASSAVDHDSQTISTKTEIIRLRKVKEEEETEVAEKSELGQENVTDNVEELNFEVTDSDPKVGEDETTETSPPGHAAGGDEKGNGFNLADADVSSKTQNENSNRTAENEQSDLGSTLSTKTENSDTARREMADSFIDSGSVASEQLANLDAAAGTEESSASTTTNENVETIHREEATTILASSSTTGTEDAVQNESLDSSDFSFYQEDREDRTDSVAVPDIKLEQGTVEMQMSDNF
ncbi:hypothetical protein L1049_025821 [Liquidambar formosana]|uniref:Uncharacterized protein n=1 Tax=Liquidambar formosana TaxID=63359 RepID=A0AAP0NFS0_LIQFO